MSNIQEDYAQSNNMQEFEIALKALLPQIQKQLLRDIQLDLQAQFQQKYNKALQEINHQAEQEYSLALKELQQSSKIIEDQKRKQIYKDISQTQNAIIQIKQAKLLKMQQTFLEENFDSRVLTHQRILQLQRQIQEQIYEFLQQKHEATKQRQLKQLIICHQTKQIKLRKQLDIQIKSRIFSSSGLQELKQEIHQSKIHIGSQKSQYNLKLKKIESQIKEYESKIRQIEKMGNLEKLRQKLEQMKIEYIERETCFQLQQQQERRKQKQMQDDSLEEEERDDLNKNNNNDGQEDDDKEAKMKGGVDGRGRCKGEQYQNERTLTRQKGREGAGCKVGTDVGENNHKNNNNRNNPKNNNNKAKMLPQSQYINQSLSIPDSSDQQYQHSDSQDQQNQNFIHNHQQTNQQFLKHQNIKNSHSKKFDLTAYFKDYMMLNSQTAKITESQTLSNYPQSQQSSQTNRQYNNHSNNPSFSTSKGTLLHLQNIKQILKQKIQMDPLQRYLCNKIPQGNQKQNNMNNMNAYNHIPDGRKSSNFAQLYQKHLKNLNKGIGVKKNQLKGSNSYHREMNRTSRQNKQSSTRNNKLSNNSTGLSQYAKKAIMKNLSQYHRNTFYTNNSNENTNQNININKEMKETSEHQNNFGVMLDSFNPMVNQINNRSQKVKNNAINDMNKYPTLIASQIYSSQNSNGSNNLNSDENIGIQNKMKMYEMAYFGSNTNIESYNSREETNLLGSYK